jgi:hypothetical protein
LARSGAPLHPRVEQLIVVVAGHDDHLALRTERGAELAAQLPGRLQRSALGTVTELQQVTKRDESVAGSGGLEQRSPRNRVTQHIELGLGAEMEIGDDQRSQLRPPVGKGSDQGSLTVLTRTTTKPEPRTTT